MKLKIGRATTPPPEPELDLWLEKSGTDCAWLKAKYNGQTQNLLTLYVSTDTGKLKLHRASVYGKVAELVDQDDYRRIVTNGKEVEG